MSQAQDELIARAQDPTTPWADLHELAQNYPGLRPYIARNPNTYPDLLTWLGSLGDPAIDAALASRPIAASPISPIDPATMGGPSARAMPGTIAVPPQAQGASAQPSDPAWAAQQAGPQAFQPAYQQGAHAVGQQPYAQGYDQQALLLGVGEPAPPNKESHHRSNLFLWFLTLVVLALVGAIAFWVATEDDDATKASRASTDQAAASSPAQEGAAPPPSTGPSASASASPTSKKAFPAPSDATELAAFTAPSGNISCTLTDSGATCTIKEHSFSQGNCVSSPYEATVSGSDATGRCATSFSGGGVTLNYGASAMRGDYACTSSESGISCWSQVTGKGFTLSRERVQSTSKN
ncbi:hypothetical protein [Actinomyces marmotae]|uniref:Leucine rich repeat variant domain-containing protein n=1 Tax=Actinomyces marmotae TaxID=2737173 RepID=A0A6M8B2Y2_9ACTO|nr:hypothetical protein [Actinomyces marmotae]QKD79030.1 hypothetical protein HPC72_01030 [Actinomyces marmotae]